MLRGKIWEFVSRCVLGVGRQPKKEDASASGATAAEKRNMERMRQMSEQVLYLRGKIHVLPYFAKGF